MCMPWCQQPYALPGLEFDSGMFFRELKGVQPVVGKVLSIVCNILL